MAGAISITDGLVGQRVRVLPLRNEEGHQIPDLDGLTGRVGTVLDATIRRALVRFPDHSIATLDFDRIAVVRR